MKRKIFALFILFFLALSVVAVADYVAPGSTPPDGNPSRPLFVNYSCAGQAGCSVSYVPLAVLYDKLGIGDGYGRDGYGDTKGKNIPKLSDLDNVSFMGRLSGDATNLVVAGSSALLGDVFVGNANDINKRDPNFTSSTSTDFNQFNYDVRVNHNIKDNTLPVISSTFAGILNTDSLLVTKDSKTYGNLNRLPANGITSEAFEFGTYDNNLNFLDKDYLQTNIGLGNWCSLYPVDIGNTIDDGGGCPWGSYMVSFQ